MVNTPILPLLFNDSVVVDPNSNSIVCFCCGAQEHMLDLVATLQEQHEHPTPTESETPVDNTTTNVQHGI